MKKTIKQERQWHKPCCALKALIKELDTLFPSALGINLQEAEQADGYLSGVLIFQRPFNSQKRLYSGKVQIVQGSYEI